MSALPITLRDVQHLSRRDLYSGVRRALRKTEASRRRTTRYANVASGVAGRLREVGAICHDDWNDVAGILMCELCAAGADLGIGRAAIRLVKEKYIGAELAGRVAATLRAALREAEAKRPVGGVSGR
jgi:hypothetical protein